MRNVHIPNVLATGKFTQAKMCRVLVAEEMGGITYSIQYTAPNRETLERYYKEDAEHMRKEGNTLFAGKFVAFRTELEVISDHEVVPASATEHLFVYGTLQDEMVQQDVFLRKPKAHPDSLIGYTLSQEKVADIYPVIVNSNDPSDQIIGKVYTLTHNELLRADAYEGGAYQRIKVTLNSGNQAWVYIEKPI